MDLETILVVTQLKSSQVSLSIKVILSLMRRHRSLEREGGGEDKRSFFRPFYSTDCDLSSIPVTTQTE